MSEELKPCPFCGGEKIRDRFIRDGRQVYCADCSASVTAFQPNATESAKSLWNCRPPMLEWRPISEADRGIAYIHDLGELRIGNSYPIWARDSDGRVFECLWSDDGKKAYWWDIKGESPVDPVEFMPHPLDPAPTHPQE